MNMDNVVKRGQHPTTQQLVFLDKKDTNIS